MAGTPWLFEGKGDLHSGIAMGLWGGGGVGMDRIQDYFECDGCRSRDFTRIYRFSMKFYTVNFSDDLVYDRLTEELFQCTRCHKQFTQEQIEATLAEFKKFRKNKA